MSTEWPCQYMPAEHLWPSGWETATNSNTWPWLSALHLLSMDETVYVTVGLSKAFSWPPRNTSAHGENKLRTKWPQCFTYCSILSRGHTFYPQQKREHKTEREEEGKKQYNTASREASRRIAWAPGLSCLYKQALIFLSSRGTSAIYSQLCGWGPAGLEKFCYSPVGPLRPVCENRFHL